MDDKINSFDSYYYTRYIKICKKCRNILKNDFIYCPYCATKAISVEDNEESIAFLFHEEENP